MNLRILFVLSFAIISHTIISGRSIAFYHISLDDAKSIAQRENKLIFIDTYATWCKPCKEMDKVFTDPSVADFFNDNFINVRINKDEDQGKELSEMFDIVWLPTLIILDKDGHMKSKIDKLVNASELLETGRSALSKKSNYIPPAFDNNPFNNEVSFKIEEEEKPLIDESNAPILYVYDKRASSGRPHIMYHEAYLHMELMDGKQYQVAKKYLSTQSDWSTDKNVKFIFDFLRTTNSPEFDFFIENLPLFERVVGKEQVKKAIEIMVYQRLSYGFPRPDLEESKRLYSYINPANVVTRAYNYFLTRLQSEEKTHEFLNLGHQYLSN